MTGLCLLFPDSYVAPVAGPVIALLSGWGNTINLELS